MFFAYACAFQTRFNFTEMEDTEQMRIGETSSKRLRATEKDWWGCARLTGSLKDAEFIGRLIVC